MTNQVLELKGRFGYAKGKQGGSVPRLPKNAEVHSRNLFELSVELQSVLDSSEQQQKLIHGVLVEVKCTKKIPKTQRIKRLFHERGKHLYDLIRGARFEDEKHVFTYYLQKSTIETAILNLKETAEIIHRYADGVLDDKKMQNLKTIDEEYTLKLNNYKQIVVDAYYIEKFRSAMQAKQISEQEMIITLYKTDRPITEILAQLHIKTAEERIINDTTVLLSPKDIQKLQDNAPYLVSMQTADLNEIVPEEMGIGTEDKRTILSPTIEPVIGMIDTNFDSSAYFNEWVTAENCLDPAIEITEKGRLHGTEVASILVDGPALNPELDDGCGHFRVKLFGISDGDRVSSFTAMRSMKKLISENRDIKVWNLSLGGESGVNQNFISFEGAELDRIQSEYDVIFVIAGTNKKGIDPHIGAPADSINAITVNSVHRDKKSASYSRCGPVLGFFNKPDVSYYGGDWNQEMRVYAGNKCLEKHGTSFAAPWIARKLAYLIYIMGMNRETAKAMILDSAADWHRMDDPDCRIGYGVVPIRIEDILNTKTDEIRFIMSSTVKAYETYTYSIPVPVDSEGNFPYFARATLVYFPVCDRNQGVDYTSTELDIHLGRIQVATGKPYIHPVNGNLQSEAVRYSLSEEDARSNYRKWDNVKLFSEETKDKARSRKSLGSNLWGIKIVTKERTDENKGMDMKFTVIVTLKEMQGVNRIDDFIKLCRIHGWIVNPVDIENRIDIHRIAEQEVKYE